MTIYLIELFLILIMSAGFHPSYNVKGKKQFLFFTFLLLTIISGIRGYTVGADTNVYVSLFNSIDYVSLYNGRYEIGFIAYLKLLHAISRNPSFCLFVSSIVCVGTYCYFAYKFSKKPTMSMLLYITLGSYFSQMNTMRQSLALSFTAIGFILIIGKAQTERGDRVRKIISALLILLSTSFHTVTVIAYLPWVLLIRQKDSEEESKLKMRYVVSSTLLIALAGFIAYSFVMRVTATILPRYAGYFYGTWSDSNYNASLFKTLIDVAFLAVGAVFMNRNRLTYLQRFGAIMLGLSIIFSTLSMRMEIWGRVGGVFGIYTYLIWVPEFLNEIRLKSNRRIVEGSIFLFSLAYMIIVLVFRPEWTLVVPYVLN